LFEAALIEDPDYPLALSGVADSTVALTLLGVLAPREALPEAEASARKALELDPLLSEAHASVAFVEAFHGRDWQKADRRLQRAIELNPAYSTAYFWRAFFSLGAPGRLVEALAAGLRAREIDPVTPAAGVSVGLILLGQKKYGVAIQELRKTLELDPAFPYCLFDLGRALLLHGEHKEAIDTLRRAALPGFREGHLGFAYAITGREGEARKLLADLGDPARPQYVTAYQRALIHTGLGECDAAFEALDIACAENSANLIWIKIAPEFDSLQRDLRWKDLMRKLHLPLD
jgi:Flp pilus assembly protein TadD